HYGTGNDIRASNLAGEAWALTAYLAGADGILPWQTVEGDRALDMPTPTAILYPGQRFGIAGPLASLRLKALRRGQQDVEYLALLAKRRGWSREQTAAVAAQILDLKVATRERFVDDAGTPLFDHLTGEQFTRLREAVAGMLAAGNGQRGLVKRETQNVKVGTRVRSEESRGRDPAPLRFTFHVLRAHVSR